jgi:hypothetical protein
MTKSAPETTAPLGISNGCTKILLNTGGAIAWSERDDSGDDGEGRREFLSPQDRSLRLRSTCIVQTRKTIAISMENASGQTIYGVLVSELAIAAADQKSIAPIALHRPRSCRKDRLSSTAANTRLANAISPRIGGRTIDRLDSRGTGLSQREIIAPGVMTSDELRDEIAPLPQRTNRTPPAAGSDA